MRKFGLKISEIDLRRVDALSRKLLRQGGMTGGDRVWFPAIFTAYDKAYKVKIRLRGDGTAHWGTAKKSWRIKFKKNQRYDGYREINLVIAIEQHFETEALAYDLARKRGLFVRDGGTATLSINRVDMGDYVWFEQPSAEMLERRRRPAGNIIQPNNSWIDFGRQTSANTFGIYHHPSGYKPVIKDSPGRGLVLGRWKKVLELVKSGTAGDFRRRIPSLIDMEKFSAWSAIILLFGNPHGIHDVNLSWYYNGATGLFEPIMYDVDIAPIGRDVDDQIVLVNSRSFDFASNLVGTRILREAEFRHRRDQILYAILTSEFDEVRARQLAIYKRLEPYMMRGISAQPPDYVRREFKKRQTTLDINRRAMLGLIRRARLFAETDLAIGDNTLTLRIDIQPDGLAGTRVTEITATFARQLDIDADRVSLTLSKGSDGAVPVNVSVEMQGNAVRLNFKDLVIWQDRAKNLEPLMTVWRLTVTLPVNTVPERRRPLPVDIAIAAQNLLTRKPIPRYRSRSLPAGQNLTQNAWDGLFDIPENAIHRSGLPLQIRGANLILGAGDYELQDDLVVPSDFGLIFEAGVRLGLGPGVSIVSHKPIAMNGTAAAPVVLKPLQKGAAWGVLGVIRPGGKSVIRHARIRGGSEAWIHGVFLSGQLSVYYGDLEMSDSEIFGSHSDDGANVKHGTVDFKRVRFVDNASDGFDGDWVTARIDASFFAGNGGDGLDFSGSKAIITNSSFDNMGDKVISSGEQSRLLIWNSVIARSAIGIASKDLSNTDVIASVFFKNGTGYAAYRKKLIFGGGRGRIIGSLFFQNDTNLSTDGESRITVDGVGADRKMEVPAADISDQRIGPVGLAYDIIGNRKFRFKDGKNFQQLFGSGPETKNIEYSGFKIHDLTSRPLGLWNSAAIP